VYYSVLVISVFISGASKLARDSQSQRKIKEIKRKKHSSKL
jgi:hypothetical protein